MEDEPDASPRHDGADDSAVTDQTALTSEFEPSAEPAAAPRDSLLRFLTIENVVTVAMVVFATAFVVINLRPGLWNDNTTPTGGDMGAHVWSPAYLRDVLLPDFRLTGWSPDWYAGFPAFTFYMVIPSLLIVVVNVGLPGLLPVAASAVIASVALALRYRWGTSASRTAAIYGVAAFIWLLCVPVPYGIAMKLVVVAGLVTLPVAAWAAGRLGGLAFPGPALLAVMTLPFIFDRSYNIYGGNLMSTMAGEFAYSLGLSMAVLYIGIAARGMETGRHRGSAAALLALAGLTHLFAAFFALVATFALFITRPGRREINWLIVVGPVSGLLAAFWVLPFFWNRALLNDMGWGKERRYVAALWDRGENFGDQSFLVNDPPLQLFVILAVVGALICGFRRVRFGMALSMVAMIFAVAFLLLPEGRLWNVRLLPFYYLTIFMMAGVAISEIGRLAAAGLRLVGPARGLVSAAPAVLATLILFVTLGLPLRSLPGGAIDQQGRYNWLGFSTTELNLGPSWLNHNFRGYESQAAWGEYSLMVATMDRVGDEFGCGRALWEYESARLGSYGTPMSPMLLPHWTDGCIGSMEGLYFEASATTPYHFLLQSELSNSPSRAQRDLPYSPLAVSRGTDHLRDLGVRYYLAFSDEAVAQGQAEPGLTEIATAGPWVMFLVSDADIVVPLDHLPVVVDGADAGGEEWLIPTVAQWEASDAPLVAASGPAHWPRTSQLELRELVPGYAAALEDDVGRVTEMRELAAAFPSVLERVAVDPVEVSNVAVDEFSISFTVDDIGSPVLVRTSYFPNWNVDGADGPYRVSPNVMVVVPTHEEVALTYGRSGIELVSLLLTIGGLFVLMSMSRIAFRRDDGALWDWSGMPGEGLPDRAEVLGGLRDQTLEPEVLSQAASATESALTKAVTSLGLAVAASGVSVMAWLVIRPGTSEPFTSLFVFMPGGLALVWLAFDIAPRLVAARRYESTVLAPARLVSSYAGHDLGSESATPPDIGEPNPEA